MKLGQTVKLYPNQKQIKYFEENFNYTRYLYNKGLTEWKNMYNRYKFTKNIKDKPSQYNIRNFLRYSKEEWENGLSNSSFDTVSEDLSHAFTMFFKKISDYPKFKKKKSNKKPSFRIQRKNNYSIQILNDTYLKIFLIDKIKMSNKIRYNGIIKSVTIYRKAGSYYASFIIDIDDGNLKTYYKPLIKSNQSYSGVDLGIKTLAVISDSNNEIFECESIIKSKLVPIEKKIIFYNKVLSRKIKGSNKYKVTITKLQKLYLRKHNLIQNTIHDLTHFLCTNYRYITIEDLKSSNMIKNRHLSKQIADSCFYEFRRQLEYKSQLYENEIIMADRWFPSSQICSNCGNVLVKENKLKLSDRTYKCKCCGHVIDRDENAAINLRLYGERYKAKL